MLTEEQKKKYFDDENDDGGNCPYCNSSDLTYSPIEVEDGISGKVECDSCGKAWWEIYRAVDIEEDDTDYEENDNIDCDEEADIDYDR